MPNELILIAFFVILAIFNLIAFKYGKVYMFMLIAIYSIIMNIFVTKQFDLFGFAVTGGNALYGATFLITDLLSEHEGKKEAYKGVIIGFVSMLIFVVATQFLIYFNPNEFDTSNDAIITLFSITPRILFGSLLAFFVAQNLDVFLYSKIKKLTKGKYLFLRNNIATILSQAVDTIIFTFVGLTTIGSFSGIISLDNFWEICIATFIIKVIIALVDTPFIYISKLIKPIRD